MRTTVRLGLILAVVATAALVVVPATASAKARAANMTPKQKASLKKAHERIATLRNFVIELEGLNKTEEAADDTTVNGIKATVDLIVAGVPDIVNGLKALETGLLTLKSVLETQVSPALVAIDAALKNETTGLVGLNKVRPQFGVFSSAGTFLGGTGAVAGASGPSGSATKGSDLTGVGGPDLDGMYVVNFGNNVASRMYSVNVLPYVPATAGGAGAAPTASAANCAASAGLSTLCGLVNAGGAADSSPNKVLVQIGDGSSGGATNGFSLTAISG